jgi:hypothetical protein
MRWEKEFGAKLERVVRKIHPETCVHEMKDGTFAIEDKRGYARRRFESVHFVVTEANTADILETLPQKTRDVFATAKEA